MRLRPLLITGALLAAGCSSASSSSPTTSASTTERRCSAPAEQRDLPYVEGGDPLQRLDLYRPAGSCGPLPLVVWVHGGGWRAGDKANDMHDKVALWNTAGWAVASVNYRLTDPSEPPERRIVAPSHNQDVAAAIAWLVEQADRLAVDATRIALLGHSAGAGIVAAIAADPTYLRAHGLEPTALVCAAPLDTEGFDVAQVMEGGAAQALLYGSVFGLDPSRWPTLSPLRHVGEAAMPEVFLVTRGEAARRAQVADFARAIRLAGGEVTVRDLPGFGHADVSRRIGDPTDRTLTPALQQFLTGCFTGPRT